MLIKKTRRDNSIAIRDVESKIDTIEKEIQSIQSKLESSKEDEEVVETVKEIEVSDAHKSRKCKHLDTGFCKLKDSFSFGQKSNSDLVLSSPLSSDWFSRIGIFFS